MDISDAVILGLVQGLTEFLPISSAGHLVLATTFFSIEPTTALAFAAFLYFGSAIALILYFWTDLFVLVQTMLRKLSRLPVNERESTLCAALAVGTVPGVVIGIISDQFFNKELQSIGFIALMLISASVFFMYVEWRYYGQPEHGVVTLKKGWIIGLFQALAILPGFSRTGSTIAGGMLLGLSRYEAARFSFLLALPIMLGLGCQKFIQLLKTDMPVEWTPVIVGVATASITSLIIIHLFLTFIKKHTLWPFIWYGVVLAVLLGYVSVFT